MDMECEEVLEPEVTSKHKPETFGAVKKSSPVSDNELTSPSKIISRPTNQHGIKTADEEEELYDWIPIFGMAYSSHDQDSPKHVPDVIGEIIRVETHDSNAEELQDSEGMDTKPKRTRKSKPKKLVKKPVGKNIKESEDIDDDSYVETEPIFEEKVESTKKVIKTKNPKKTNQKSAQKSKRKLNSPNQTKTRTQKKSQNASTGLRIKIKMNDSEEVPSDVKTNYTGYTDDDIVEHDEFDHESENELEDVIAGNDEHTEKGENEKKTDVNAGNETGVDRAAVREALMKLVQVHADKLERKKYKCTVCEKTFLYRNSLRRHKLLHGDGRNKKYKCEVCDKTFPFKGLLRRHATEHVKKEPGNMGPNTCKVCGKQFKKARYLPRHMMWHKDKSEWSYVCEICAKPFPFRSLLIRHQERVHVANKPFVCPVCSNAYAEEEQFERHLRRHTENFQCDICGEMCAFRYDLDAHKKSAHGIGKYRRMCCGSTFTSLELYVNHCQKEHGKVNVTRSEMVCLFCSSESFPTRDDLITHVATHAQEADYFPCDKCECVFNVTWALQMHQGVHASSNHGYVCPVCDQSLSQKHHLRGHLDNRHDLIAIDKCPVCAFDLNHANYDKLKRREHIVEHVKPPPTTCNVCKQVFMHPRALKRHKNHPSARNKQSCALCEKEFEACNDVIQHVTEYHSAVPPSNDIEQHFCLKCGKSFPSEIALANHAIIHDPQTQAKFCDICKITFSRKTHMRTHMMKHMGTQDLHPCEHCGKSFNSKPNLRRHILTHIGVKQFACDICGKTFSQKTSLKDHQLIHSESKPYSCEFCSRSFRQKSNLRSHMRRCKNKSISSMGGESNPQHEQSDLIKNNGLPLSGSLTFSQSIDGHIAMFSRQAEMVPDMNVDVEQFDLNQTPKLNVHFNRAFSEQARLMQARHPGFDGEEGVQL